MALSAQGPKNIPPVTVSDLSLGMCRINLPLKMYLFIELLMSLIDTQVTLNLLMVSSIYHTFLDCGRKLEHPE